MMIRWANDGVLRANSAKMLANDGEMLVNTGEMNVNVFNDFTIINEHKYNIIRSSDHHWDAAPTEL